MLIRAGLWYEFHRERIIPRQGQPPEIRTGVEIGPIIDGWKALSRVKNGKDVYTFNRTEAYQLALRVDPGKPVYEPPHEPADASPTGRLDVYYPHFHPAGDHENYGHIFYGSRGEGFVAKLT